MAHSTTGVFVRARTLLSIKADRIANKMPTMMERNPRTKKSLAMVTVLYAVNSLLLLLYETTVLKRMIETASFVIPSPKTREKSLGCFSGLIRETAAMTSVEHNNEHIMMTSRVERSRAEVTPVSPFV